MKKILLVMSVAILIALCSAPSFIHAATRQYHVGQAVITHGGVQKLYDLYSDTNTNGAAILSGKYLAIQGYSNYYFVYYYEYNFGVLTEYNVNVEKCSIAYIPTLDNNYTLTYGNYTMYVYHLENDYENNLPDEFRPSLAKKRWDAFYEWYKQKFGYYPVDGSLIDLLRKLALGDEDANTEIIFPTMTPTPSPTPTPTPIPVQTIFVPDGNGSTTIIYQYTDPTTGVITQSPYNPNIQNNIEINCDCNDDAGDGVFSPDPQDPTALTSSMLWADGFGVEISDNPLTAANDSQQSLSEAAAEYSDSVNVVTNSFNVLPFKWLTLVGLLGGILIIAGLIRTFLGG